MALTTAHKRDMIRCFYKEDSNSRQAALRYAATYPDRHCPHFTYFRKLDTNLLEYGAFNHKRQRAAVLEEMEVNILAAFELNARASVREVADELGCSLGLVHKVLKKNRYKAYKVLCYLLKY